MRKLTVTVILWRGLFHGLSLWFLYKVSKQSAVWPSTLADEAQTVPRRLVIVYNINMWNTSAKRPKSFLDQQNYTSFAILFSHDYFCLFHLILNTQSEKMSTTPDQSPNWHGSWHLHGVQRETERCETEAELHWASTIADASSFPSPSIIDTMDRRFLVWILPSKPTVYLFGN